MALTPVHLVAPLMGASYKALPVTHINPQQVCKATLVVCCKFDSLDKINKNKLPNMGSMKHVTSIIANYC